jgi:hypothetical protein
MLQPLSCVLTPKTYLSSPPCWFYLTRLSSRQGEKEWYAGFSIHGFLCQRKEKVLTQLLFNFTFASIPFMLSMISFNIDRYEEIKRYESNRVKCVKYQIVDVRDPENCESAVQQWLNVC